LCWHDWWCGDGALKDVYLELYSIAQNKEAALADYICWNAGSRHWDITFMRDIQYWEMAMLRAFMDLIYDLCRRPDLLEAYKEQVI
jgi:hypothetical protein